MQPEQNRSGLHHLLLERIQCIWEWFWDAADAYIFKTRWGGGETHASFIRQYQSYMRDGALFPSVIAACRFSRDHRERPLWCRRVWGESVACGFSPQQNKETKIETEASLNEGQILSEGRRKKKKKICQECWEGSQQRKVGVEFCRLSFSWV